MPAELTLLSAFLVGLLGSTHCIGMCGGIAGALTLGVRRPAPAALAGLVPYLLAYNAGRIASYALAGAVFGYIGSRLFALTPDARLVARLVAGGFMAALGLYLTGWWRVLSVLERAGGRLWRRIEPIGRRFLPIDRPGKALVVGMVWGWLPCGMVYAALAWSLSAGSALEGAALMSAFGAGTLPALLAAGAAARWLGETARAPTVRRAVGVAILLFGAYALVSGAGGGHHGHAGDEVTGGHARHAVAAES
ncbi:MAG TPA: sulfite exporter TauE/SafE family protein [Burkholderiales bacterium]